MPMRALILTAVLLGLAGCGTGAQEADYPPERGISADIAASHFNGSGSDYPGMLQRGEPLGAFPWNLDELHQSGD